MSDAVREEPETSTSVVPIGITPKTHKRQYKGALITVTFNIASRKWAWSVERTQVVRYSGEFAPSIQKAFKAAEKFIDNVVK